MTPRTITFRCSEAQFKRLQSAVEHLRTSRAALINDALEDFLDFAERPDVRALDLFELVKAVDSEGDGCLFCDQA